jgi:hypothetical protein
MKYYSIRAIEAENHEDAIEKVMDGCFDEDDPICDKVLTRDELSKEASLKYYTSQNINWSREQELGLLCCIIMQEDIVSGTLFQTFDKVFEIADAFIQKYGVDGTEWGVEVEYDEAVIEFAKSYVKG